MCLFFTTVCFDVLLVCTSRSLSSVSLSFSPPSILAAVVAAIFKPPVHSGCWTSRNIVQRKRKKDRKGGKGEDQANYCFIERRPRPSVACWQSFFLFLFPYHSISFVLNNASLVLVCRTVKSGLPPVLYVCVADAGEAFHGILLAIVSA